MMRYVMQVRASLPLMVPVYIIVDGRTARGRARVDPGGFRINLERMGGAANVS